MYYVIALGILLALTFYIIYSLNFSLSERALVSASVSNFIVNINGNNITVTNIYNFPITVCYGNQIIKPVLYPGKSVTFNYQPADNYVILKANGFEEIIKVN
ncbi:TPA: hypothetical protein HA332_04025 [Sulfurisphaera tokodaii]|uniref:Uncharacterized protein n=1 Tax=Sulfurisphaera tokodaii TaxID=111955 RepID=A0A832WV19_9CREN|nr:hypothetical protein [Sulfurisphaera tokodaii]